MTAALTFCAGAALAQLMFISWRLQQIARSLELVARSQVVLALVAQEGRR